MTSFTFSRLCAMLLPALFFSCATLKPVEPTNIDWSKCDKAHLSLPEQDEGVLWIDIDSVQALQKANQDCLNYVADIAEENAQKTRFNREAYEQKTETEFDRILKWAERIGIFVGTWLLRSAIGI